MIDVRGLTKSFDHSSILNGLNLTLEKGARAAVLGPTGCGKTTLLRLIAGLERPDAGEIRIGGRIMTGPGALIPPHRRGVAMVFQNLALWPHMTVRQNLLFCAPSARGDAKTRLLRNLSAMLDIGSFLDTYPPRLSGGERQRVALARALAADRSVLLLDEPFASFDTELRALIARRLKEYAEEACLTVVVVTHHPGEVADLAPMAFRFNCGRLMEEPVRAEVPLRDGEE